MATHRIIGSLLPQMKCQATLKRSLADILSKTEDLAQHAGSDSDIPISDTDDDLAEPVHKQLKHNPPLMLGECGVHAANCIECLT